VVRVSITAPWTGQASFVGIGAPRCHPFRRLLHPPWAPPSTRPKHRPVRAVVRANRSDRSRCPHGPPADRRRPRCCELRGSCRARMLSESSRTSHDPHPGEACRPQPLNHLAMGALLAPHHRDQQLLSVPSGRARITGRPSHRCSPADRALALAMGLTARQRAQVVLIS